MAQNDTERRGYWRSNTSFIPWTGWPIESIPHAYISRIISLRFYHLYALYHWISVIETTMCVLHRVNTSCVLTPKIFCNNCVHLFVHRLFLRQCKQFTLRWSVQGTLNVWTLATFLGHSNFIFIFGVMFYREYILHVIVYCLGDGLSLSSPYANQIKSKQKCFIATCKNNMSVSTANSYWNYSNYACSNGTRRSMLISLWSRNLLSQIINNRKTKYNTQKDISIK